MLLDPTRAQVIGRLLIGAAVIAVRVWLDRLVPRGRLPQRRRLQPTAARRRR